MLCYLTRLINGFTLFAVLCCLPLFIRDCMHMISVANENSMFWGGGFTWCAASLL